MAEIVIVSGLSGSGKSTALRALEDVGYFCMDNVPVALLPQVIELTRARPEKQPIAAVIDARDRANISRAGAVIDELRAAGLRVEVLFLESAHDTIVTRFVETRRRHPLERDGDVSAAVESEWALLRELSQRADIVLDTSDINVHELKERVQRHFGEENEHSLAVRVVSFGFKYGTPPALNLVFDVRFVNNPYFVPSLRASNGLRDDVEAFVTAQDGALEFVDRVEDMLAFLVPRYRQEGKVYLNVGIGCTGGQHRSVCLAEVLAERLVASGVSAHAFHRESARWPT